MGRPLRRVPGLGQRRGGGRPPQGRTAAGPVSSPGRADRPGLGRGLPVAHQRRPRARPGARRRHGPRGGRAARRRARRRQVHAAARGGRPDGPLRAARALRHRRGVRLPGAAARRPHRRRSTTSSTSPRRPTWARCSATSRRCGPQLLVVDSVQTIGAADVDGVPGGVTQVKEVAAALVRVAKTQNIATVLVGHVTKDGSIAGPRVLEHLVDVVLHFEGERSSRLRMVRAVKNRFGPVDEVGCFDLSGEGIVAVTDPTGLFVARHHEPVRRHLRRAWSSRAAGRSWPRCRRWSPPRPPSAPAVRRPGWTARGSRWWSPCSSSGPGSGCTPTTCSPPPSAASGSPSRPPTWPRHRDRLGLEAARHPDRPGGDRRDRPGRRAAPGARPPAAAGRGGPARVPRGDRAGRVAPGRRRGPHRQRHEGGLASPTSTPRCGCSTSASRTARRSSRCTAPSRDGPRSGSCSPRRRRMPAWRPGSP